MNGVIKMQSEACSKRNLAKICAFDRESVSAPTEPILYQGARFLLITKGKGAIRVRDKGYELLLSTEDSVIKIALDVGYRTIKTFNRQFLRIMGTSPGSFRKANRLSQGDLVD